MKLFLYLLFFTVLGINTSVNAQVKTSPIDTFSHGYFACSFIYHPAAKVRGVALLLTQHKELANAQEDNCHMQTISALSAPESSIAQKLSASGILVAVLDINRVLKEQSDGQCTNIDGDLENFSRVMQARYQLPSYRAPLLIGVDRMGEWVYSRLASASPKTYGGGISVGFIPELSLSQPMCESRALKMNPAAYDDKTAAVAAPAKKKSLKRVTYHLLPSSPLGTPWVVVPTSRNAAETEAKNFVNKISDASLYAAVDHEGIDDAVLKAANQIMPRDEVTPQPPAMIADLPIIEMPSKAPVKKDNDVLAIMVSGDGGWAGIDKDLGGAINKAGISVIGFDSLRYFWKARTPDSTTKDMVRLIQYYQSQPQWKRSKVLLIGYSQGADILPFVVNRLPAEIKNQLADVALLSLGRNAAFEFHVTNWISSSSDGLPIAPEVAKFPAGLGVCIYGDSDEDALCPDFKSGKTPLSLVKLPGDHHFDGAYDVLAKRILARLH